MFKQIKSALFWYYLYKFRKKVILIAFLLILAISTNAIYSDVVEYLTLKEKLEFLEIALISKWVIIIFSILSSIAITVSIFSIFKPKEEKLKGQAYQKNNDILSAKENKNSKFSKREEEFLKKDLKSKADLLVER